MLLILAYWFYLFAILSVYGLLILKLLKAPNLHPVFTLLLGGFAIIILSGTWILFGGLNYVFDIVLAAMALGIGGLLRKDLRSYGMDVKNRFRALSTMLKLIFTILVVFAAAKSSGVPFILDNESYYIQTIKWLDTYGLVKGLANIHPFLAQTSGWHILQSALNIDGTIANLNDLNGFFLCAANFYAVDGLNKYYKSKKAFHLFQGSFLFFNVFLFQFIDAPSPDLPIYICTFLIFSEFFKEMVQPSKENRIYVVLFCLAICATFIKVTAILMLLFPIILLLRNECFQKRDLLILSSLSIVTFLLFLTKNFVISGYPLYPLQIFGSDTTTWKIPDRMHYFITHQTKLYGFFMSEEQFQSSSAFARFIHWLSLPGLHGFFNKTFILLLAIFPFVIWKSEYKKPFFILLIFAILQLILVWFGSPQYRFFFGAIMLLLIAIFTVFIKKMSLISLFLIVTAVLVCIPLVVPMPLSELTNNRFQSNLTPFSVKNIVFPHPNTRFIQTRYVKVSEGKFTFYSPAGMDFFWGTGDGPLPTMQAIQFDYFRDNYNVIPQQLGKEISDGFYSLNLRNE